MKTVIHRSNLYKRCCQKSLKSPMTRKLLELGLQITKLFTTTRVQTLLIGKRSKRKKKGGKGYKVYAVILPVPRF